MNIITITLLSLFWLGQSNDADEPAVVHPTIGTSWKGDGISVTFIARKQNYDTRFTSNDPDINSPKSVNIHPDGTRYYVNSLEGASTVVYDFATGNKRKVIHHEFKDADSLLWAPESGFFPMRYAYPHPLCFTGKPVESTFSHKGRYLWIPYYRRSYDINAQDPSAMAVIDTERDSIIRLFETGPLPKMVAVSRDGKTVAVSHWGNNTVGLLDISSDRPEDWKWKARIIIDYELPLNYSRTEKVDRDSNSGYALRGTVFTPDGKYLLIGCMGGGGGIAVVDLEENRYLGRLLGVRPNLRHLVIGNGYLYASINRDGYVQRLPLETLGQACEDLRRNSHKELTVGGWVSCKVPAGTRTIELSPNGRYIFAACNFSSTLAVIDALSMKLLGTLNADSYPVGLDVSQDGRFIFTTSQGRDGGGGNAVNIFEVRYR